MNVLCWPTHEFYFLVAYIVTSSVYSLYDEICDVIGYIRADKGVLGVGSNLGK